MKKTSRLCILICALVLSLMSVAHAGVSVSSDNKYFDIMSGSWVLEGDVVVQTDTRTIGADTAKVNLIKREVWADGHIYLDEPAENIHFEGGSLYAADETKTAEIKGDVLFERPDISIRAERCTFNWQTKIAEFSGLVEVNKDSKIKNYDIVHYDAAANKIIDAN